MEAKGRREGKRWRRGTGEKEWEQGDVSLENVIGKGEWRMVNFLMDG
jgi:hypothetical protein